MKQSAWQVFSIAALTRDMAGDAPKFNEFLRTHSLSCAVYHLPAGSRDLQSPHLEDEVYIVLNGRARVRIGGEERSVGSGDILLVRATAEHSFFSIEEDLTVIAVFGAIGLH